MSSFRCNPPVPTVEDRREIIRIQLPDPLVILSLQIPSDSVGWLDLTRSSETPYRIDAPGHTISANKSYQYVLFCATSYGLYLT